MYHYTVSTTYLDKALKTRTVSELEEAILCYEMDLKIHTNMIGDVDWSLKHWILNTDKLGGDNGELNLTYNQDWELTSISASMLGKDILVEGRECRLCTRMWVRPDVRNHQYVAKYHVLPGLRFSAINHVELAWVSFNTDRHSLMRRINMLKHHDDKIVARIWRDWEMLPVPKMINNVEQRVMFCKVEPYWKDAILRNWNYLPQLYSRDGIANKSGEL